MLPGDYGREDEFHQGAVHGSGYQAKRRVDFLQPIPSVGRLRLEQLAVPGFRRTVPPTLALEPAETKQGVDMSVQRPLGDVRSERLQGSKIVVTMLQDSVVNGMHEGFSFLRLDPP